MTFLTPGAPVPMSRQEVESILQVQRELLQNSRDVKGMVQSGGAHQQAQQNVGGSQDHGAQTITLLQQLLSEQRQNMETVRREFGSITTRLASPQANAQTECPQVSCLTSNSLILFLAAQAVLIIVGNYLLFGRDKNQAKKFY